MPILDSAFRLRWRRTWPDEQDFTARRDDGFCRIYYEAGGPQGGRWFWTASKTTLLGTGHADTARAAALAAEQVFLSPVEAPSNAR